MVRLNAHGEEGLSFLWLVAESANLIMFSGSGQRVVVARGMHAKSGWINRITIMESTPVNSVLAFPIVMVVQERAKPIVKASRRSTDHRRRLTAAAITPPTVLAATLQSVHAHALQ